MTFEKLQQDMIAAMKARDADRKEVLSNLVSATKKAAIDKQSRDNITEEIVRLKSHCAQLRAIAADSEKPVGKKLDFLVQEMNRESNTIGSKANDINITNNVLILKAEIEKIREQIQNIE